MKTEPTEALAKQAIKKIADSLIFEINYEEDNYDAGYSAALHNHGEALYMMGFLEGQSSPKIRQLEWRYDKSDKIYIAELSMFEYRVWQNNDKSFMKAMINNNHCTILRFRTIDEAKAAAQADFEKRVKECLE